MIRTQIQLTEQQSKAVKAMAKALGISTAGIIRRAITVSLQTA
jgi:16S rRNA U516 pseudouridylate synthase RsuA-like enzyme